MWKKCIVAQQHSQVAQHLSWSKHIAAAVRLKDQPGRHSSVDESSATSLLQDLSNLPLLWHICEKHLSPQTYHSSQIAPKLGISFSSIFRQILQTSQLKENYLITCYEETLRKNLSTVWERKYGLLYKLPLITCVMFMFLDCPNCYPWTG